MAEQNISLEGLSLLEINSVVGDLYLYGWKQDQIQIKDIGEEDQVKQEKDKVALSSNSDLIIKVPYQLEISIKSVAGDAVIKDLQKPIEISQIGGDLDLKEIASPKVESVGGDLFAAGIQGDLQVNQTGGNILIDGVRGQISITNTGGDLQITKVDGGIEASAGGSARINFTPVPWQAYQVEAGGDISASIPDDSSVELSLSSGSGDLTVMVGEIDLKSSDNELTQQIGEGGPKMILKAGGRIFLSGDDYTWVTNLKINVEELEGMAADFSNKTAEQIRTQISHIKNEIESSLSGLSDSLSSAGISEENLQKITSEVEESGRMAAHRAEIAAIKAQAKIDRKIAKARRQALRLEAKGKQFDLAKFLEKREQEKKVTEQERMLILNMLQENKISPEEADDLLRALEGKKKQ
jgi:hypothetical protein